MGQDEVNAVMQGKPLTTKRSPKETTESFGIGLKIVREFVQMHRGRFWIEPSSPAGAQFCFTLPVNLEASRKQK
jgi:signal transduction histidine kinase